MNGALLHSTRERICLRSSIFVDLDLIAVFIRKKWICTIFRRIRCDHLDWKVIIMQIMENIPISRSIFLIGIAVFQSNKFIVCRFRILLTARIYIGILPGCRTGRPCIRSASLLAAAWCNGRDFSLADFRHQPMKVDSLIGTCRCSFVARIKTFQPATCKSSVFFLCFINFVLICNFSFLIFFLFRDFDKSRCRMSITEGFIVMIFVLYSIGCITLFIGRNGRNKPIIIPYNRIIQVFWQIRFMICSTIQFYCSVTFQVDLILIIKTLIKPETWSLQSFSRFMIILSQLRIISRSPVLLMPITVKFKAATAGGSRWIRWRISTIPTKTLLAPENSCTENSWCSHGRIIHTARKSHFHVCQSLMLLGRHYPNSREFLMLTSTLLKHPQLQTLFIQISGRSECSHCRFIPCSYWIKLHI